MEQRKRNHNNLKKRKHSSEHDSIQLVSNVFEEGMMNEFVVLAGSKKFGQPEEDWGHGYNEIGYYSKDERGLFYAIMTRALEAHPLTRKKKSTGNVYCANLSLR